MENFKIYQIYYDDSQKLDGGFIPYKNKANEYLENQVILDLVDNADKDYFGVVSHKFFEKTGFNSEKVSKIPEGHDVYAFFAPLKNKNHYLYNMDKWHKGSLEALQIIAKEIGIDKKYVYLENNKQLIPTREIVYQNHFIARSSVYKKYVNEMLRPAVHVMKNASGRLNDLLWSNSKYSYENRVSEDVKMSVFGVPYYPLHPFVCERFFSIWLTINKDVTVKQYFKHL